MLVLASCNQSAPEDDLLDRVQQARFNGQYELAWTELREAIRADPGDAELRLLLAEVYLDLEQGDLARTAIEQALERGLALRRSSLPLGRALFLERRWSDLLALGVPPDLGTTERTTLLYLQAEARAAQSGSVDGTDDTVVSAYIELFAATDANAESPEIADLATQLTDSRAARADIERAWQHYTCSTQDEAATGWKPIDRSGRRVLQVGPDRDLKTIAAAAELARDGDIVEIYPGTYPGDVALWPQNNLIVRGVDERPLVTADGKSVQRRDVWLFTGNDVVVENVEISGARSPWENGAGIRHIGSGLTLRHVFLHDNENGVLTSNRYPDTNEILIEYSEFADNGDNKGLAHNMYIGRSKRFELRYSYSHGSQGGHLVKSRAKENLITYNRLTDEEGGRSSYIIDIPEAGIASIVGNVIAQGAATLNHGMISYAGESDKHPDNRLAIVNNSIYNRGFEGVVVRNHRDLDVVLVNNLLGGAPAVTTDSVIELINNLMRPEHGMRDPRSYAFGLMAGAPAIDAGVEFVVTPSKEYVHPVQWRPRQNVWRIDVGAFERCGIA
jgi:tetratricopeptide (TPR) repeat protein